MTHGNSHPSRDKEEWVSLLQLSESNPTIDKGKAKGPKRLTQ